MKEQGVFNFHTETWHVIPPPPKTSKFRLACGLMVGTSEKPYTFKLIEGNVDFEKKIYDSRSRSWSTSSRLIQAASSELNDSFDSDDSSDLEEVSFTNAIQKFTNAIQKFRLPMLQLYMQQRVRGHIPRGGNDFNVFHGRRHVDHIRFPGRAADGRAFDS